MPPFRYGRHSAIPFQRTLCCWTPFACNFFVASCIFVCFEQETSELFHPRAKEHKQGKKNCKKTCIFHIIVSFAKQQQRTKAQNQKTRVFLVYSLYETTICSSVNHVLAALAVSLLIHFSICGTWPRGKLIKRAKRNSSTSTIENINDLAEKQNSD